MGEVAEPGNMSTVVRVGLDVDVGATPFVETIKRDGTALGANLCADVDADGDDAEGDYNNGIRTLTRSLLRDTN